MLAFLKSRTFLVIVGLALLSLLIWFAGPYFAFADHKPLESVVARLVTILDARQKLRALARGPTG